MQVHVRVMGSQAKARWQHQKLEDACSRDLVLQHLERVWLC